MCDLKTESWRASFTGPPCRCGVPTPGTPEEREIDIAHRKKYDEIARAKERVKFEEHKKEQYKKLYERHGLIYRD